MDAQGLPLGKEAKSVEADYGFSVSHQKVDLDIDLSTQSLTGRCEITILPQKKDLHEIKIDARQCVINSKAITVNGKLAEFTYQDPMKALTIHDNVLWTAHQADMQRDKLKPMLENGKGNGPLAITIPEGVRIEEIDPLSENAASTVTSRTVGGVASRMPSVAIDGPHSANSQPKTAVEQVTRFQPLVVVISFAVKSFRDGLHFVGLTEGDNRFPHVFTKHAFDRGTASCIFPCVDDSTMRCTWDVSIKVSRTLGDALKRKPASRTAKPKKALTNGITNGVTEDYDVPLSDEEKLLEMTVVCSGELTNEISDLEDSSKKIVSFTCPTLVAPQHIGFAVGPFEQVDLSEFREVEDDEKLGQGQTVAVLAYCLPGRADEVRHTCEPMAHALDWFLLTFGAYPFQECRFVFVDDQVRDTEHTASLSICSNRLLFGRDIIDPEVENVRTLVHAIASQYIGVAAVPSARCDRWITVGISHFMTGIFMKSLCGHNEYAFRQKELSDKLVELDIDRPSIYALGEILNLGPFEYDFLQLKAPLVLFILDKRLIKASGSIGLMRIITRIIINVNTGSATDSVLSTEGFRKLCEKVTKYRQTETFWNQWVLGSGCPRLAISQKFNKKRLCVEMTISQKQDTLPTVRNLQKDSFTREFKEDVHGIYAGELQSVFTGPMTIRIHEADGTPYEHIVELREGTTKIEIPYNTKYKRLKRSRRQKERLQAGAIDPNAEGGDDALYYCLGDVLQKQDDLAEWGLVDWDADTEAKMDGESYEWIRLDADFEWLCEKTFVNMPAYMYVSQLQQDRDVVAQQESMLYLKGMNAHPLVATFLVRTLMDPRYFHGIRTMAADFLRNHASVTLNWAGQRHLEKAYQQFFCYPDSKTPRPNDFSDKRAYKVELAIAKSLSQIRDNTGNCPKDARMFLFDMLQFNDNSNNDSSDVFKISNLLTCLTEALIPVKDATNVLNMDDDEEDHELKQFREKFIEELARYARMDEWANTYQNLLTVTILDCRQRLMKAKLIPWEPREFVEYMHDGSSDYVRVKAFRCLVELGCLTKDTVPAFLLNVMSTDKSPHLRRELFEIFCLGMATIAFGENKVVAPAPPKSNGVDAQNGVHDALISDAGAAGAAGDAIAGGDLLVEEDGTAQAEARRIFQARTTTIEGALLALKDELKNNTELKEAIWKAVKSPVIGMAEQLDLLDVCHILYDAVEALVIKLRLPRTWKATNEGKGIVKFKQTKKIRTKPSKPYVDPNAILVVEPPPRPPPAYVPKPAYGPAPAAVPASAPAPAPARPVGKVLKLNFGHAKSALASSKPTTPIEETMKPPSTKPAPKRPAPDQHSSQDDQPRKRQKVVKMRVPMDKVLNIQSFPPNPAPVRAKSLTKSASPAPRASSAPRSSPAPKPARSPLPPGLAAPRTALPGSSPATPRTALPTSSAPARTALPTNSTSGRTALPGTAPRTSLPPNPITSSHGSASPHTPSSGTPTVLKFRKPLPGTTPRIDTPERANTPKKSLLVKLKVNFGKLKNSSLSS